jgi:hypothetical protein
MLFKEIIAVYTENHMKQALLWFSQADRRHLSPSMRFAIVVTMQCIYTFGPKLGVSSLTWHLAALGVKVVFNNVLGPVIVHHFG